MFHKALWPLTKRTNRAFAGIPLRSVAFYGPDDRRASKVVVGIVSGIISFIDHFGAKSVIAHERILGCPRARSISSHHTRRWRWTRTLASNDGVARLV
jgi:hypothetical protein